MDLYHQKIPIEFSINKSNNGKDAGDTTPLFFVYSLKK